MGYYSVITCYEVAGSVQENFSLDSGMEATVKLHVPWNNRYSLVQDILINQRPYPGTLAFAALLRPLSASIVPRSGDKAAYTVDTDRIIYTNDAEVTIKYSNKVSSTELVSEEIEPAVDFIKQDYRRFRWGSNHGPVLTPEQAPGKLRYICTYRRTIFNVTSMPAALVSAIGCVNQDPKTVASLGGVTFAEETLLYKPPKLSRTIRADGANAWRLSLEFIYKPESWNKYWREETESYERIFEIKDNFSRWYKSYPPNAMTGIL